MYKLRVTVEEVQDKFSNLTSPQSTRRTQRKSKNMSVRILRDLCALCGKIMQDKCTAPHRPGDYFEVENGNIRIPDGKFICLYSPRAFGPQSRRAGEQVSSRNKIPVRLRSTVLLFNCPSPQRALPQGTTHGRPDKRLHRRTRQDA
jgi:uncharacterized repeat protein (TIGR04076 family)